MQSFVKMIEPSLSPLVALFLVNIYLFPPWLGNDTKNLYVLGYMFQSQLGLLFAVSVFFSFLGNSKPHSSENPEQLFKNVSSNIMVKQSFNVQDTDF